MVNWGKLSKSYLIKTPTLRHKCVTELGKAISLSRRYLGTENGACRRERKKKDSSPKEYEGKNSLEPCDAQMWFWTIVTWHVLQPQIHINVLAMEYAKAVYCHSAYLTYMQSTSWETLGWKKHKLESRLPGEISITSDMQIILPLWLKWRGTKKPLDESERGEWKGWLKAQHSENKDNGMWSHHFMANRWGNSGNGDRLCF